MKETANVAPSRKKRLTLKALLIDSSVTLLDPFRNLFLTLLAELLLRVSRRVLTSEMEIRATSPKSP